MKANKFGALLGSGLVLLAIAPGVAAHEQRDQRARDVAALKQRETIIESSFRGKQGAVERLRLREQREEINALMRRLSAGENVSPAEIDQALRRAEL